MAGPIPKKPVLRQRENRVSTASMLTDDTPTTDKNPDLPERKGPRGGKMQWRAETIAWWKGLWNSPMADEYLQLQNEGRSSSNVTT